MTDPVLQVASLSKTFGGEAALVDAGLELGQGEIRALIGANGSGKSTLVKLLAGYHHPDDRSATIRFEGEEVHPDQDGGIKGVRFIHQDLGLVDELSVVDNVMIDPAPAAQLLRPRPSRAERAETQSLIEFYGLRFSPSIPVRELSSVDRTMVALMRALRVRDEAKVLVLDEVTAALPPQETDHVLKVVRELGCAVLFVSHRIEEILGLCHTATVLRSGRVVADLTVADTTESEMIEALTGRRPGAIYPEVPAAEGDQVLEVRKLTGGGISELDLNVRRGELVGLASAEASEATRVLSLIFGELPRRSGSVAVDGEPLDPGGGPDDSCRAGIHLVTDRLLSSIPSFTVRENLTVGRLREVSGRWRLKKTSEKAMAAELIAAFGIAPPNGELVFAGLSGGNQQKGVLARAMSQRPRLLLLDDPTRGVDVGAKAAIYRILRNAAEDGLAVLMVSSDFDELASLCHRVVVLKDGRMNATVGGADLDSETLIEHCYRAAGEPAQANRQET